MGVSAGRVGRGEMSVVEEILELAKALGKVGERDTETLKVLCRLALEELTGRLKEGVGAEECAPALALAAAWMALADLCVGECVDGVESFTAGGLTIRRGEKTTPIERCAALRKRAELVLSPYLKDEQFSFLGVRG